MGADRDAAADSSTSGKSRHVGSQYRRDREFGGAEDERKLAGPGRFVDQGRETRKEEAGRNDDEGAISHPAATIMIRPKKRLQS